ncbi:hypothetical protein TNCV_1100401 [Trichonephila clavipes]|nr:hypothetical protein TNCV_1100401 [Trichonephila clavipes]
MSKLNILPVYFLDTHHLLVIHRHVYRNFVDRCILNIPLGTKLHMYGDSSAEGYLTDTLGSYEPKVEFVRPHDSRFREQTFCRFL